VIAQGTFDDIKASPESAAEPVRKFRQSPEDRGAYAT
jgi:hypothetical protein